MKAIFEPELDGDSVVIWEAGTGHRIIYQSAQQAEIAFNWLVNRATQFHVTKDETGVAAIDVYGDSHTVYTFIRHYLSVCKSAGRKVMEDSLSRPASEFW